MEHWASKQYHGVVNFLCIGCAGPQLAVEMGNHAHLNHAVNSFISGEANMPQWGQLGCNGFIVLDAQHDVVSPCSKAFMQVRNGSFRDVESMLNMLLADQHLPKTALTSHEAATADPCTADPSADGS